MYNICQGQVHCGWFSFCPVLPQYVLRMLTYGAETLTLTKKSIHKIGVTQRAMERAMFGLTLKDKVPNEVIGRRTGITYAIERITTLKWNWAGHMTKMRDGR